MQITRVDAKAVSDALQADAFGALPMPQWLKDHFTAYSTEIIKAADTATRPGENVEVTIQIQGQDQKSYERDAANLRNAVDDAGFHDGSGSGISSLADLLESLGADEDEDEDELVAAE